MSTARSKATRDDDVTLSVEVPAKIADAVARIGTALAVRLPIPNEEGAMRAQELFIAKCLRDAAEGRYDAARKDFLWHQPIPSVKGKHIVHNSAVAVVTADRRASPKRLSEGAVLTLLINKAGMTVDEARAAIDDCKFAGNEMPVHLSVVLK